MAALGTIATARQLLIGGTRRLIFAEFGDPEGTPVFLFHGLPATRLFRHPDDALTASLGIRLITIDRPGVGMSDRQPGRSVLDWPDDVSALADVLKIGSFAVLGHAAGGPYAAACAYRLPGRITKAAIVSGLPPVRKTQSREFKRARLPWPLLPAIICVSPWMMKVSVWLAWNMRRVQKHHHVLRILLNACSEPDYTLLTDSPELHGLMEDNLEELFHAPYIGYAEDLCILMEDWGFDMEDIRIPVTFWYGECDGHISVSAMQHMAQVVPNTTIHSIPNAGHYLLFSHWEPILCDLHSATRQSGQWTRCNDNQPNILHTSRPYEP